MESLKNRHFSMVLTAILDTPSLTAGSAEYASDYPFGNLSRTYLKQIALRSQPRTSGFNAEGKNNPVLDTTPTAKETGHDYALGPEQIGFASCRPALSPLQSIGDPALVCVRIMYSELSSEVNDSRPSLAFREPQRIQITLGASC